MAPPYIPDTLEAGGETVDATVLVPVELFSVLLLLLDGTLTTNIIYHIQN